MARVAPRANVAVPLQPEKIRSHPQVRNPKISLLLQLPGDVNANPPGRYGPARCENPSPTGRLMIGWGLSSQRAARVAHRIYAAVPPHPGKISSNPRVSNRSISLQPQIPGDVKADLLGQCRLAGCGNASPTGRLLIGWASRARSRRGLPLGPTPRSRRTWGGYVPIYRSEIFPLSRQL